MTKDTKNLIAQINTLRVYANTPTVSRSQHNYLVALSYLLQCFEGMDKNNNLCMYISENTFLIANHSDSERINPFVFVNEKGEILFDVDIEVFELEIKEFENYIKYYDKKYPEYPSEKKIQKAIKDYKNDKLDFYANSKIVLQSFIDKARSAYKQEYNLD